MKNIKKLLSGFALIVCTLCSFTPGNVDDVVKALNQGSASKLSKFFDRTIDISLPDSRNTYSKSQAELILQDFFSSNTVISFKQLHKGDANGAQYCIGTLETRTGVYRTSVFIKQKGDKDIIQELRIER